MKLSWSFTFSSLYCSALAASKAGHVFVYDPSAKAAPQQPPSVSPETARLILAQRLGVSRYHSIKTANEYAIEQLNTYGGQPQRLFSGVKESRNSAHALIWVEDVEDVKSIIKDPSAYSAEFTISSPPSSSDNDRLIQDIILQAQSLPKKADPLNWAYAAGVDIEAELQKLKSADTYNINSYLNVFHTGKEDKVASSDLSTSIANVLENSKTRHEPFSITVVVMPPSSHNAKRSAQPYGTYGLPSSLEARRETTEALLSPTSSQPSASPQNPNDSNLEDFPTIMQTTANDTSPVLGILPSCFDTLEDCEKETHGCSNHGSCLRLHKGQSGSDSKVRDCYGCSCVATIVKVGEANKTTVWGGPACQKKDVSVPFWLFVGTGVTLAFLISGGIGLLYSMGSEELPSVIGAGVSGPTRK